jgi:hypothetical protein
MGKYYFFRERQTFSRRDRSKMAGAGADVALAIKTLALKETCSHCGKQSPTLKRCSNCKQVSYCGAECQKAGWKKHKKKCAPPLSVMDVMTQVEASFYASDWEGVLKWEGRMEELAGSKFF